MNQIVIDGYRRVSRPKAKRLYDAGDTIRICPLKFSPVNAWGHFADICKNEFTEVASDGFNTTVARNRAFQTVVNAYTYYNCQTSKDGLYPAFYVKET